MSNRKSVVSRIIFVALPIIFGLASGAVVGITQAIAANNTNPPLGTNINGTEYYSTEWPFVDVFKTSSKWISQKAGLGWNLGPTLNLDANGWVTSLCSDCSAIALMLWRGTQSGVIGEYIVLYDGEGTILFKGATVVRSALF